MSELTDRLRKSFDSVVNERVHMILNQYASLERQEDDIKKRKHDLIDKIVQEMLEMKNE